MRKFILVAVALCAFTVTLYSQNSWKPAGDKIRTSWTATIDPGKPLNDYPRPQLKRTEWMNLNGLWDYALLPAGSISANRYDGKILVPFPVESALSGVGKPVGADRVLFYSRSFTIPSSWRNRNILLHFGAIDWQADVWINGIKAAQHKGGYSPFTINITPYLEKGEQTIVVRCWDPADKGFQPRGKQVENPGSIWYTSVTGIWQTVWLEPVMPLHISNLAMVSDIDHKSFTITPALKGAVDGDIVKAELIQDGKVIASAKAAVGQQLGMPVENMHLWSPEDPYLYDVKVSVIRDQKVADVVTSYAGMRKISARRDAAGIMRMQLNNRDYFQFGPLDQGWWPDGLYTAPSDEALVYDIKTTKELGFNMIRKHVKVEPDRWYWHCDRLGILVWQDMPSGDRGPEWQQHNFFNGVERKRTAQSADNFRNEWKEIITSLISHPSIVCWVPFNEAWGQFDTEAIVSFTKKLDPTRLVNPASGGNHYPVGDILDVHNYPDPRMTMYDQQRVCVLGEYGGIGLAIPDHLWNNDKNWGYVQYKSSEEATGAYVKLAEKLITLIPQGFSAAVYTQTTDVENEVNGLMTYDRKMIKLDKEKLREINSRVTRSLER